MRRWGAAAAVAVATGAAAGPVKVVLYGEAGCPDTQAFITTYLHPAVSSVGGIMDLTYYAWGNSYYTTVDGCSSSSFSKDTEDCWIMACNGTAAPDTCWGKKAEEVCQHGAGECYGNVVSACALHNYPDVSNWEPFIKCMAQKGGNGCPNDCSGAAQPCALEAGLDWTRLNTCATGADGDTALQEMAKATASYGLARKDTTPWVLVGGDVMPGNGSTFLQLVCDAYTGTKPKGCASGV